MKINILTKTNIDLKISFNDLDQTINLFNKLGSYLVQKMGISFHPCPKTYALFAMIKGRMKVKTAN